MATNNKLKKDGQDIWGSPRLKNDMDKEAVALRAKSELVFEKGN